MINRYGLVATLTVACVSFTSAPVEAKIRVGVSKFKYSEACPNKAGRKCAITNEGSLRLNKSPILTTNDAAIWSHVAGIFSNNSGSVPARCATSVIPDAIIEKEMFSRVEIDYRPKGTRQIGLGVDMMSALTNAGASSTLIDNSSAGIKLAYKRVSEKEYKTQAEYWGYKLNFGQISSLKGGVGDSVLDGCIAALKQDPRRRMSVGVGGFWINQASAKSTVKSDLILGIKAALKTGGATDTEIASLSASIENESTRIVDITLSKVFEGRVIDYITANDLI